MQNLKAFIILFLSFFCGSNKSFSQNRKVELPATEVLKFKSAINGQDYVLYISLPDSYDDTTKRYPVLYVLDAQYSFTFPSIRGIQAGLFYDGFIPEMIIVGITWPDDYEGSRKRDFTLPQQDDVSNSGTPKFLNVLKNEIITSIDSRYRSIHQNNTLEGGSLSGQFTLYTLFNEPALFNRYIIGGLNYNSERVFDLEKAFAKNNHVLNAKLFIYAGEYEEQNNFSKFIEQIKTSKYQGLQLESLIIEKMAHVSQVPYGVSRGLQFVFSEPEAIVDTLLLSQYTGNYELSDEKVKITRIKNSLYLNSSFGKLKLYAKTDESFYAKGIDISVQFIKGRNGKVSGFNFRLENNVTFYKKLD